MSGRCGRSKQNLLKLQKSQSTIWSTQSQSNHFTRQFKENPNFKLQKVKRIEKELDEAEASGENNTLGQPISSILLLWSTKMASWSALLIFSSSSMSPFLRMKRRQGSADALCKSCPRAFSLPFPILHSSSSNQFNRIPKIPLWCSGSSYWLSQRSHGSFYLDIQSWVRAEDLGKSGLTISSASFSPKPTPLLSIQLANSFAKLYL